MDKNELKLLAQKYFDGIASPEEKRLLDQWYDSIHTGWPETVDLQRPETENDVKQRLFNNLHQQLFEPQQAKPSVIRRLAIWSGSVAAVLALAFFAWTWSQNSKDVPLAIEGGKMVNVPLNRVMHLTLADGSRVWLNKGSVFRYPKTFNGKNRVVELLEGRAFFDIKHQANHPFVVKTKSINITVLGTSFDVSAYQKSGLTKVSVVTGKVGVSCTNTNCRGTVFLLPKQQLTLNANSTEFIKKPELAADLNGWCKSNFVFEQESLNNVFRALEKEYHTKINVTDRKLLDERISISLNNQHLDSIMKVLSFTKHFKYQMANDSTVIIKQ